MKSAIFGILLLLIAATSTLAQPQAVEEEAQKKSVEQAEQKEDEAETKSRPIYWDNGLWIAGLFGQQLIKIGGQVQIDTAGFVSDSTQPVALENGVEWRRARVYALGAIRKRWNYKFQWDFSGGQDVNLIDAWLQFRFNLLGNTIALRSGRFGTTFGLENDGSSNDTLFMEQGFTLAFVPPQETGVLLHNESQRRRWDFSFSSGASEVECLICNILGIAGRYSMGFDFGRKDRLLHFGVNASRRWTDDAVSYRQRPESHIAPVFVDTGPILAESVDTGLLEGAYLHGPYSLQGEYVVAGVKQPDVSRSVFYAFYVSGSYALTGEMRQYRHSLGTIRRIRPKREFRDGSGGLGAFEVALRFSRIDLNDRDITGGTLNDLTFAFNWYPTYPTRVSFNVIRSKRETWNSVWIFQARLQLAY
jgi:phosphate-selective porin OprO/OprP